MSSFAVQTFSALSQEPGIGARSGHAKMLALVTESTKPFLFRSFGFVSINRNSRMRSSGNVLQFCASINSSRHSFCHNPNPSSGNARLRLQHLWPPRRRAQNPPRRRAQNPPRRGAQNPPRLQRPLPFWILPGNQIAPIAPNRTKINELDRQTG